MRLLRDLLLLVLALTTSEAADLTGHWVSGAHELTQISIWLESKGNALTGYLTSPDGPIPIGDSSIKNNSFAFAVVREFFGEQRRVIYSGMLSERRLRLIVPAVAPGDTDHEVMLTRVSTDPPKPILPPTLKITLPPAPDVPDNGLAKTPPMGWNSGPKLRREVSDPLLREQADALVANGMRDAGYVYVNIDDGWQGERDAGRNIKPNNRFPDMKALGAYLHAKGLKFGLSSSPGPKTCGGFEGTFGHEERDVRRWAEWGVDFVKYDWCSGSKVYENSAMPPVFAKMGWALHDSGHPIVYSICQYGVLSVGDWAARSGGNLWRTTPDIRDNWWTVAEIGFDRQTGMEKYAGPGHWNDPDTLQIGIMSEAEDRAQMSLWSLLAAPLLVATDLRKLQPNALAVLTNKEVIAVDQDGLGRQGRRLVRERGVEVWARPLADGTVAVGLFNRSNADAKASVRWKDLGIQGSWNVRDLWEHADKGPAQQEYSADVASHGVVMLKLSRN